MRRRTATRKWRGGVSAPSQTWRKVNFDACASVHKLETLLVSDRFPRGCKKCVKSVLGGKGLAWRCFLRPERIINY